MPKENEPSPAGFYSVEEVADRAGLHPESVLRGVREGRYNLTPHSRPAWRTARKYFFRIEEVNAFCSWLVTLRA